MIRKFISEFVGTMLLVIFGCGTAVAANTYVTSVAGVALPFTMLLIACAFGLVLTALVYTIGKVSGCHVNPAVSIAALIDGRVTVFECVYYVCAQILGGITGAAILAWIMGASTSLGANAFYLDTAPTLSALGSITTLPVALVVEMILTFIFVLVVLSTTKKENCNSGIVIGLTLTLVHIFGLPFTGTSVNPARSIGPAIFQGGVALEQLWVFIVAPIAGAILAALFYRFVISEPTTKLVVEETEDTDASEEDEEEVEEAVEEVKEEKAKPKKTTSKKTKKKDK